MKIYTTAIIDELLSIHYDPDIFYRRNYGYRKANLMFSHTHEELIEYCKCTKDPIYFFEKYCIIQTPNGNQNVILRDYQKKIITAYFENRFNVAAVSRQIGISTITNLISLHEAMFNVDNQINVIGYKICSVVEKLDRIKDLYARLPFFLKPGVIKADMKHITFDNGCRICVDSSCRGGYNIDKLFIEDYANLKPSVLQNIYPAMMAQKNSKMFINSTPNGMNHFYQLFSNAVCDMNDFVPHKVYWWQVPGRDEEWKKREIANLGSEDAFEQEYNIQFISKQT